MIPELMNLLSQFFLVTAQCEQHSPIPKRMNLMMWFFLVNQKHLVHALSLESVHLNESEMHSAIRL